METAKNIVLQSAQTVLKINLSGSFGLDVEKKKKHVQLINLATTMEEVWRAPSLNVTTEVQIFAIKENCRCKMLQKNTKKLIQTVIMRCSVAAI